MEPSTGDVQIVTSRGHLPLRIRPAVPLSDDALFELCRINRDLRIERTAAGEIIITSPTGGETGTRNFTLTGVFAVWVAKDGSGVGFDSSTGFVLPNGAERAPDVAWLRKVRWGALSMEERRKFVPLCPDFVIELRSPSDGLEELDAKMREYVDNGAALGWLIDPDAQRVWVYKPGSPPERLDSPRTLAGDPILPGFVLDLAAIW